MTPETRTICVFTGSRAEYGLLVPILRRLEEDERFELKLVVAGAHLSLLHGETYRFIESDGFRIEAKVEMLLASDTPGAVGKSLGLALIELSGLFDRMRPDAVLLLGDRTEALAAAIAATLNGLPLVHIHGGELTRGAFDDAIRHCITKLSHLHFTAAEQFRRRVVQLGEEPERVFTVGAPGVEAIRGLKPLGRGELEERLAATLTRPLALVAYHPATLPGEDPAEAVTAVLDGVRAAVGGTMVLSLPNADPRYSQIREIVQRFAAEEDDAFVVSSLGHGVYLSLLAESDLLVGNSSSGIIEAPVFGTPTVNVGIRQEGRPRAPSVIDCPADEEAIREACRRALSPGFRAEIAGQRSPYDVGVSTGALVVQILGEADLPALLNKGFHDLPADLLATL